MGTPGSAVNPTAQTTPLLERLGRPQVPHQPRWLRIQQERLAERERRGGSRYDAVADLTGTVAL